MLIYHDNSIFYKSPLKSNKPTIIAVYYIFLWKFCQLLSESYACCFKFTLWLFEFLSFWGIFKGYARAFGSTLIYFSNFTGNCSIYLQVFGHSVSLVARRDTTLICICKCIRVRNHTIDHLCNTSCLQVVLYI